MKHDGKCELNRRACRQCTSPLWSPHCHCGSRAFSLCKPCRCGLHVQHHDTEPSTGETCQCDLCAEETAA